MRYLLERRILFINKLFYRITSFMIKQSLPAVSVLSKDTIEEFKTQDKVVTIAYFDADDKSSNETFTLVADGLRDDFLFGATSDPALAKEAGVKAPAIVLYKDFDEKKTPFTGKFDKEAIEKFVQTASVPLVGEVGPDTYASYMAAKIPLAYIFAETPEERTELAETLKSVAEKHRGVINFATIDAKQFGAHAGNLNLKADSFPAFAIQDTVKNQKYPFEGNSLTLKDISAFVQKFADGKIEASIKSEPVPETQEGPVQIVVAKNYDEIVLDDKKDVLIEFYAPWCGHCKALAPKYDELAAMYANDKDLSKKVTIAKVDATLNDVPDEIQGFPTIKMYPAGGKDAPVLYSGSRSVDDLIKFIKENGKYGVEPSAAENATEDSEIPDSESVGKAAAAASKSASSVVEKATDAVKDKASEASAAVKSATEDSEHDEL
jgi:protein disulfide-isomerase A1